MKAIVQDAYGSADVLELRDIAKPRSVIMRCWSAYTLLAWIGAFGT